jgi:hypothetical protein
MKLIIKRAAPADGETCSRICTYWLVCDESIITTRQIHRDACRILISNTAASDRTWIRGIDTLAMRLDRGLRTEISSVKI